MSKKILNNPHGATKHLKSQESSVESWDRPVWDQGETSGSTESLPGSRSPSQNFKTGPNSEQCYSSTEQNVSVASMFRSWNWTISMSQMILINLVIIWPKKIVQISLSNLIPCNIKCTVMDGSLLCVEFCYSRNKDWFSLSWNIVVLNNSGNSVLGI